MKKALCIILALIVTVLLAACSPQSVYDDAKALMESQEYELAKEKFEKIPDFEDSTELAKECADELAYIEANKHISDGNFEAARDVLASIRLYKDCDTLLLNVRNEISYAEAKGLMDTDKFEEAAVIFQTILSFNDSEQLYLECNTAIENENKYQEAVAVFNAGNYIDAYASFNELSNYKDSEEKVKTCSQKAYEEAVALLENNENFKAYQIFSSLNGYADSNEKINDCALPMPKNGVMENNASGKISVKIKTPDDGYGNYLKIYKDDGTFVQSLFINSGGTATVKLQAGTYTMNLAAGQQWFGEKAMFGDAGIYQKLYVEKGDVNFKVSSKYRYTLTLNALVRLSGALGDTITPESF